MLNFFKKYWPELIVFGFIFAILFNDLAPDYTFMNKAADSIGYSYSAKYLYPSFHTSPPLYLLLSHLFLQIPFGTDAYRMELLSLIATMVACLFIYLTIRKMLVEKTGARWYALLGVLVYGCSALVISQTVIIQTYPLTCMLAAGAFYFSTSKHWKLCALFLGLGLIVHLLAFFIALVMMLAYKELRKNWKCWAIMASLLVFYIYIPITNRPPYMWMPDPTSVNSGVPSFLVNIYSFVVDTLSTIGFLIGKLSVWDTPKKIIDMLGVVGVSIGVVCVIPVVYYFWKTRWYTKALFWLAFMGIFLAIINLDPNTFDYCMLSIPFLAIISALGLQKLAELHPNIGKKVAAVCTVFVIGFGSFNMYYFDVGRTMDKDLSASNLYYNEMSQIPDGAIFMPGFTWEWEAIFKFNKDFDRNLRPVAIDILPSKQYTDALQNDGIKLTLSDEENDSIKAREIAKSIIELNDNVYTTVAVDPSTFKTKVVNANGDSSLIDIFDKDKMREVSEHPTWKWMPDSPFSIMSTEIMMDKWTYILLSGWNISLLIVMGVGIGVIMYYIKNSLRKKKK